MNVKNLIEKYGIEYGNRYRKPHKVKFLEEISKDFNEFGYNVRIMEHDVKKNVGINAYIGDVENSKRIVIANYDTTINSHNKKMKYYPFDSAKSQKSLFKIPRIRALSTVFIVVFILYLVMTNLNLSEKQVNTLWFIMTIVMVLVGYLFMQGMPNKNNANLNTSGVVGLLSLAKNKPRDTAFILVDHAFSNHLGDLMVNDLLKKTLSKKNVILLNGIGSGSQIVLSYKQHNSKFAASISKENESIQLVEVGKEALLNSSLNFYPKAVSISVCKQDGDTFYIDNVMNKDDTQIDENIYNHVIEIVLNYLK